MHSAGFACRLPPAPRTPRFPPLCCSIRTAATRAMKPKSPIWLDVDAGVDDAQGLLLALAQPEVEVMGISAVHGNVDVEQVGRNIARVLLAAGRQSSGIPFYLGAAEPYLAAPLPSTQWYGRDGLGDAPDAAPNPEEALELQPEAGHAAVHLAAAAQRAGGQLTVVATGPTTNIALAAKIDTAFPQNVKELVLMGGAEGRGNATATAEYNFYWDAEAAHVTLKTFPRVTLLTWDCCLVHRQPWSLVDAWLCKATPKARFLSAIMRDSMEKERAGSASWT